MGLYADPQAPGGNRWGTAERYQELRTRADREKHLPAMVRPRVESLLRQHRKRVCTLYRYEAGPTALYIGESTQYWVFRPDDGQSFSFRTVGNETHHAGMTTLEAAVGERVPMVPGSAAVSFVYFLGHPTVSIYLFK